MQEPQPRTADLPALPAEAVAVESWPFFGQAMPPFLDDNLRNEGRIRVRYWQLETRPQELFAQVYFYRAAAGPPGHVHGGAMAALLDELMVLNVFLNGTPAVAVSLHTDFKQMLPVECGAQGHSWIESVEGRKITGASTLRSLDGEVLHARAQGIYLEPDEERAKALRDLGYDSSLPGTNAPQG